MLRHHPTETTGGVLHSLGRSAIALLFLATLASAQEVQPVTSQAQLAAMLCRNPADKAANELLNQTAQFVDIALWHTLVNCASSAQPQRSPLKAVEIYKLMLRVADRLKQPELIATTYYYLGRTYAGMNDFQNSIQAWEMSRRLFDQTGDQANLINVLADLGAVYFTAGDYGLAQSCSEQSLAIGGRLNSDFTKDSVYPIEYARARSLHTLGQIDLNGGKHAEALTKLNEALTLLERLNRAGSSYKLQMADVLIALAKVYGDKGEYGKAFSCLTKAHQVSRSSEDQNMRANIMSSQASLFLAQEDYATALKYFNESLRIHRLMGNTREEARVLLNLAVITQRQGRDDDARQLFELTLERATLAKLVDVQIVAGEELSVLFTAKHDFPNALQTITQGLELARRVNSRTREAELLWRAAQTSYAMQNYRESAVLAEQAVTLASSLGLPKLLSFATVALGEAYAANEKVELAITTLKESIDQIEALRDQVAGRQESRPLFFESKVGPYHTLVKLLTNQGKNFEALLYAERAKGRVLLEAVRNNRADLKDIYSEEEKAEADFLINKLHAINQRIQSQPADEPKDALQNELNSARNELVLFQERLAAAHPELLLRTDRARPLTQLRVNTLVNANDVAYLEYVVMGDRVGLFILKRNGVTTESELKYLELPVNTDDLRRRVNEFHSTLAERQPDYVLQGRDLYRLLIAPAANDLQDIGSLCIIPDDFLWTLPFQALTTTRGSFLINEHSLYYAPSLSVLNEMAFRTRQQTSNESLIAFANPVIARNDKLKQDLHPIPESESEVAAVARAVRTQQKRVLVGSQADEMTFKALAPQYATIHLATHGILDNREPLNSYLLLTKTTAANTEDDGLLHAREIIEMHLNADLAVLSACETGNGKISRGEGVIGMSWAFFVAGARSVVVSQWQVNSASTSQLMKNFYEVLVKQKDQKGLNKSEALREASVRLLQDRRYRHPFYWAGFVLISSN